MSSDPLDKAKNAEGLRARRSKAQRSEGATSAQSQAPGELPPSKSGMAPLLKKIIRQYATTGLPPAYLPVSEDD